MPKDQDNTQSGGPPGEDGSDQGAKPTPAKGGDEHPGGDKEGAQAPGQGTLPPLHDGGEAKPVAPGDAREHLEQATRRILEETRQYRRGRGRPSGSGVRDW